MLDDNINSDLESLGKILYDEMDRLDPDENYCSWESLSERERQFYIHCVESLIIRINQQKRK